MGYLFSMGEIEADSHLACVRAADPRLTDDGVSVIGNVEAVRVAAATSIWTWAVAAIFAFLGHADTMTGMALWGISGVLVAFALLETFFLKRVQVLKSGAWVTIARYTFPSLPRRLADQMTVR